MVFYAVFKSPQPRVAGTMASIHSVLETLLPAPSSSLVTQAASLTVVQCEWKLFWQRGSSMRKDGQTNWMKARRTSFIYRNPKPKLRRNRIAFDCPSLDQACNQTVATSFAFPDLNPLALCKNKSYAGQKGFGKQHLSYSYSIGSTPEGGSRHGRKEHVLQNRRLL